MKAIVLAAGKGKRLRGIINLIPKPMVKIKGKPILEHNIELLRSHEIKDIYINLHHMPEVIRDYFGNGEKWGVYIVYKYEPKILGTAGAVKNFEDLIGLQKFMVVYGDNCYCDYDLGKIIDFHNKKKGLGTIALYEKDDVSHSGIVEMDDDNKILRFIEKPKPQEMISHLVNTGIYVFEPDIFNFIPDKKFSDFGNDIFPKILKERENLYGIIIEGRLIAIDTPESYKSATEKKIIL